MKFHIHPNVIRKLHEKHGLTESEVKEAFAGRLGGFLEDTRDEHKSDPVTMWFIGETDSGKLLKVAFLIRDDVIIIRTAYRANPEELHIYKKYALSKS